MTKRVFQWMVVLAMLAASFASTGSAMAWGGCASYITVQWGDTLSGIAAYCGTTIEAIQAANPGLGWWVYAGQVLYIPTGYAPAPVYYPPQAGNTYVVQWGDTLGIIAARTGFTVNDLLAVNPQIWNPSLIYTGQVINLPGSAVIYTPPPTYYPAPDSTPGYSTIKVTNKKGLLIRTGPGTNYAKIESEYGSAIYRSTWQYRKNSVTVDSSGFVWVEITFTQPVDGYSTGWILVKDSLGNYFTNPTVDP
jgi:LysM repeat protein